MGKTPAKDGANGKGERNRADDGAPLPLWMRATLVLGLTALGVLAALRPGTLCDPDQKLVLFFLLSVLAGLLFTGQGTRFNTQFKWFALRATGATAVMFGCLCLMTALAGRLDPGVRFVVVHVDDESGNDLPLLSAESIRVLAVDGTAHMKMAVTGNEALVVFPGHVRQINVTLKRPSWEGGGESPPQPFWLTRVWTQVTFKDQP